MKSLPFKIQRVLERANDFVERHHGGLTVGLVTLLVGFTAAAVAVAPGAPSLPRQVIVESIQPKDVAPQLEVLAERDLQWYRTDLVRAGDTIDALLARLGVHDHAASAFLRKDKTARKLLDGRAVKMVRVQVDQDGTLRELVARYPVDRGAQADTHFNRMTVRRDEDGKLAAQAEVVALVPQVRLGSGTVYSSLYAATDEARIPEGVAEQLAEIFANEVDFRRGLRRGDTFSVVYETLTADGEPVAWNANAGRVLAAEFVNNGKISRAMWFRDPATDKGGYFGFDGKSMKRAFLAAPMEFSRVTSGFAMRMHPILQDWRAHKGVDYGAPMGTPVRSVGDGEVTFAGWQNGYGNVIEIDHGNERSTVYAHLSRIDVKLGQLVEQGQRVGAVGMTGWATGPHLHFEFRVNGEQRDPQTIAKASDALVISPSSQSLFASLARSTQAQLDAAVSMASAEGFE